MEIDVEVYDKMRASMKRIRTAENRESHLSWFWEIERQKRVV